MLYCSFYASLLKTVGIWINKTLFLKHSVYSCIIATRICSKNSLLTTPKTKKILKVEYLAVKHPSWCFPLTLSTLILLLAHQGCQVCLLHHPSILSLNLGEHQWWNLFLFHLCHTQNLSHRLSLPIPIHYKECSENAYQDSNCTQLINKMYSGQMDTNEVWEDS